MKLSGARRAPERRRFSFALTGELTAVAIVEAPTIYHARMRLAAREIGNSADFGEGKELDAERAVLVPAI
jgi:hypothetical protein